MTRNLIMSAFFLLPATGCGEAQRPAYKTAEASAPAAPVAQFKSRAAHPEPASDGRAEAAPGVVGLATAFGTALQAPIAGPALARKIVYDGQVDLIVKDVDAVARQVSTLIQDARGYIAEQSTTGSPGSPRSMRWKLRIPVEQFEPLVDKLSALGELERNSRTSQDVTEQFYDIEARIKNKKAEEKSLTKILDERTGKLEDVLKVEAELSRVRGEIEQLEGKIRVLESLSSLATLALSVREREKFEPSPPTVADFPTQVSRAWESSVHGMVDLGKGIVLWLVGWAIWIPLLVLAAILGLVLLRWFIRRLPRLIALANTPLTPPRGP